MIFLTDVFPVLGVELGVQIGGHHVILDHVLLQAADRIVVLVPRVNLVD